MAEDELMLRVGDGLGITRTACVNSSRCPHSPFRTRNALAWPTWARTVRATFSGMEMTHCVPNEHVEVTR